MIYAFTYVVVFVLLHIVILVIIIDYIFNQHGRGMHCVQATVQPLKYFAGRKHGCSKILASWVVAAVLAIPQLLVETEHTGTPHDIGPINCENAGVWQRKAYVTYVMTYMLVIPTLVMTYCYAGIARVVWQRAEVQPAQDVAEPAIPLETYDRSLAASDPTELGAIADRRSVLSSNNEHLIRYSALQSSAIVIRCRLSVVCQL